MAKGVMKPLSIRGYGLFDEDGNRVFHFNIDDPKERVKINKFTEKLVDYEKDIVPAVSEDAISGAGADAVVVKPKEEEEEEKEE